MPPIGKLAAGFAAGCESSVDSQLGYKATARSAGQRTENGSESSRGEGPQLGYSRRARTRLDRRSFSLEKLAGKLSLPSGDSLSLSLSSLAREMGFFLELEARE